MQARKRGRERQIDRQRERERERERGREEKRERGRGKEGEREVSPTFFSRHVILIFGLRGQTKNGQTLRRTNDGQSGKNGQTYRRTRYDM